LERPTTLEAINQAFEKAADGELKDILAVSGEPLVSTDLIGNTASAIIDLSLTNLIGGNLVKVIAWYDNEWGYSMRLVEMAKMVGKSQISN